MCTISSTIGWINFCRVDIISFISLLSLFLSPLAEQISMGYIESKLSVNLLYLYLLCVSIRDLCAIHSPSKEYWWSRANYFLFYKRMLNMSASPFYCVNVFTPILLQWIFYRAWMWWGSGPRTSNKNTTTTGRHHYHHNSTSKWAIISFRNQ